MLLVVDGDLAMRQTLAALFREQGFEVAEAASADEALARIDDTDFDAVLSDVRMPGRSGVQMLGEIRQRRPGTPVMLMTAIGSIDSVLEAMRAGAFDYITKPFEPDVVRFKLDRALERRALEDENRRLRRAVEQTSSLGSLVGASPAMCEIIALVKRVAHSRSNVLITGELGTGKELVARSLHYHGVGHDKPFVPVHCAAIPERLLETELFGHVRGAVPGTHASKPGLFEKAQGGAIFLDEIGCLPLGLQAKLLRVLQDREIRPVGGSHAVRVDVRILATTRRDLEREMAEGRFREDLFHRLGVICVHIPPLRERPEDLPLLVEAFLRRHDGTGRRGVTAEAMARLLAWPWKGNARELENVLARALGLGGDEEIGPGDLLLPRERGRDETRSPETFLRSAARRGLSLRDVEDLYIEEILARTGGNKVRAAKLLGIDRKTLYRRSERGARGAHEEEHV